MPSAEIVIVGCGPAGAVLGLLLARSGIRVTLLEQAATFEREFRGEALQAGTQRIFDDIGLGAHLRALDHGSPTGVALDVDGRSVRFDFATGPLPVVGMLAVPQPRLLQMVVEEAQREPGFSIRMGAVVRDLMIEAGRVCGVRYSDAAGELHDVPALCVVAADGRASAVRRLAQIPMRSFFMPYDLVWFSVDGVADTLVRGTVRGREVLFGFPSRSQRTQIGWLIEKQSYGTLRSEGFAAAKARIVALAPEPLRSAIENSLRGFDDLALLPAVSQMARRWWRPGLLLIGDAAHPSSPVGAQGINLAIADAVVAARSLAIAARSGLIADTVLAQVERERRGPTQRVQRQQNTVPFLFNAFGSGRVVRMLLWTIDVFARLRMEPPFLRGAVDRFSWGDPPVRADQGPWATGRPGVAPP